MISFFKLFLSIGLFLLLSELFAQTSCREKILMDRNWKFSLGHPYDPGLDFNFATAHFSFYAKGGFADGPSPSFDDRAWRKLDLPHDWAFEATFDSKAIISHGYNAIGRNFPERNNVPAEAHGEIE